MNHICTLLDRFVANGCNLLMCYCFIQELFRNYQALVMSAGGDLVDIYFRIICTGGSFFFCLTCNSLWIKVFKTWIIVYVK